MVCNGGKRYDMAVKQKRRAPDGKAAGPSKQAGKGEKQ